MDNDTISIVIFIALILQIIMVIKFFQAVADVSRIRKYITKNANDKLAEYEQYIAFDQTVEARKALEDYVWERKNFYKMNYLEPAKSKSIAELRELSEPKLIAVGSKWPE